MDDNSTAKVVCYLLAGGLMALYFLFIVTRMARSDGAQQNLAVLAAAFGVGAVAALIGAIRPRGGR